MGGSTTDGLPVNEMVNLLNKLEPSLLESCKSHLPNIAYKLKLGVEGGGEPSTITPPPLISLETAKFTLKVLEVAQAKCQKGIEVAAKKVNHGRRARFIGQCISILCGSGVIATISKHPEQSLILAIAALIGSFATAYADYSTSTLIPGVDASKTLTDLGGFPIRISFLSNHVSVLSKSDGDGDGFSELSPLIQEANALCGEVDEIVLPLLGYSNFIKLIGKKKLSSRLF